MKAWDMEKLLAELRDAGWCVAIHNDYRLHGRRRTFWLLTLPDDEDGSTGVYIKGEGASDEEALTECAAAARKMFGPLGRSR